MACSGTRAINIVAIDGAVFFIEDNYSHVVTGPPFKFTLPTRPEARDHAASHSVPGSLQPDASKNADGDYAVGRRGNSKTAKSRRPGATVADDRTAEMPARSARPATNRCAT